MTDATIKFTCPSEFNDPFDSKPHYHPDSFNTVIERRPEVIERLKINKGWTQNQLNENRIILINNLRRSVESGQFWNSMISNVGVLSLSRDPFNILMWSHYADEHKGFVVEFKSPTKGYNQSGIEYLELLVPLDIDYTETRPIIDIAEKDTEKAVDLHLRTKSILWKYEQEERVIDHKRGPGIHPYNQKKILHSVICGCKMLKENRKEIFQMVKAVNKNNKTKVRVYVAKEKVDKYEIYCPNRSPQKGDDA